jgi:cytochrome c oxidase subunit 3
LASSTLEKIGAGAPPPPRSPDESGPGGRGQGGAPGILGDAARFGLLAFLATVSMLFLGFTSAYILRRASADWQPLSAPGLLWLNTAVLAASSLALQAARGRLRGWDLAGAQRFTAAAAGLGFVFLLGQVLAWRELQARGVFLASNPHSSFFYLLTAVHALHLVGGLVWGLLTVVRLRTLAVLPGQDGLRLFATYWHFLGALWLYLLFLLFVY